MPLVGDAAHRAVVLMTVAQFEENGVMSSIAITEGVARDLVAEQFPQWAHLPVREVDRQGWDNRTFRLGDELAIRLPSGAAYVAGIEKEDRWLPTLSGSLPLPVPSVVATGRPGCGFPFLWSVRHWLRGDTLTDTLNVDRVALALDLGDFLTALRSIAPDGPPGGRHSHFRGCHPSVYSGQVDNALSMLGKLVDAARCRQIWAEAVRSVWPRGPAWFHGDIASDNLLMVDGKLSAVIDFGTCGVGDPACDLVIAWTYFTTDERTIFHRAVGLDDDTWRRARGWALWKALVTLAGQSSPDHSGTHAHALVEIVTDALVGD